MNFIDNQAIYLQIADKVCENILTQKWVNGERIPPVREIAVNMEVNPNTANRAYDFLQSYGIIFNKRGIGYFVADDGYEKAVAYRKKQFIEEEVPQFLKTMKLVGITCTELENYYQTLK